MVLNDYKSECDLHQSLIVCKDKGNPQEYIAYNKDGDEVYKYQVDGIIIKDGQRCDFFICNNTKNTNYFIELKGTDISKAFEQLQQTESIFMKRFKGSLTGRDVFFSELF